MSPASPLVWPLALLLSLASASAHAQQIEVQDDLGISLDHLLPFGTVEAGTVVFANVTISETSNISPLTINSVTQSGSGQFSLFGLPGLPRVIPAGGSLGFGVAFQPDRSGVFSGLVDIDSDATNDSLVRLTLSGEGSAFSVSNNHLDFGSVFLGDSVDLVFDIVNSGVVPVTVSDLDVFGDDFSLVVSPTAPFVMPAVSSQRVTVRFAPTAAAMRTGVVLIESDDPIAPLLFVDLTGTGLLPATPLSIEFDDVFDGSDDDPLDFGMAAVSGGTLRTVRVTNASAQSVDLDTDEADGVSVDGPQSTLFTIDRGSFNPAPGGQGVVSLGAGMALTFDIAFIPTSSGIVTALLKVPVDLAGSPAPDLFDFTTLNGEGVVPQIRIADAGGNDLAAAGVDFGNRLFGESPVSQEVFVQNVGAVGDVIVTEIALDDGGMGFTLDLTSDGWSFPQSVPPGSSMRFVVEFSPLTANAISPAPTSPTPFLDNVQITSNAMGAGSVALSGQGVYADRQASTIGSSASSAFGDGTDTSTITVTVVRNDNQIPLPNAIVTLASSRGVVDTIVGVTSATAVEPTNGFGEATFTVSSDVGGASTYSATVAPPFGGPVVQLDDSVMVRYQEAHAANSTVIALPPSVRAGQNASVTVTIRDGAGDPIQGALVSLDSSRSGETIVPAGPATDAGGVIQFSVSSTVAGNSVYTARTTVGTDAAITVNQSAAVAYDHGAADNALTLFTPPGQSVVADGATEALVSVTVSDAFGNPVDDAAITVDDPRSPNDVFSGAPGTTDGAGQASFGISSLIESDGVPVSYTVTVAPAAGEGPPFDRTADVTWLAGAPSAALSTVVADPATIEVSAGSSQSTVTVTVRDASSNTVPAVLVGLGSDRGSSVDTISAPVLTAEDGVATFTVSSQTAGEATLSATANGGAITQTTLLTVVLGLEADLSLSKADSDDPVIPGINLSYVLTVSNSGPSDSSGGTVTDPLPAEVSFVSSADGCTEAAGVVTCPFGPLPSGMNVERNFVVAVGGGATGSITNMATVTGNESDPMSTNNQATETTTVDDGPPTVTRVETDPPTSNGELTQCETALVAIRSLGVQFSEPVSDSGGGFDPSDVTNPANYELVAAADDKDLGTASCAALVGDDVSLAIDGVSYDAPSRTASLQIDGSGPLGDGPYRLLVCGSTSIEDLAGNPLDGNGDGGGGDDFALTFRVDIGNLFDSGNFDCGLDPWLAMSADPSEIGYTDEDVDDSSISGSANVTNLAANTDFELAQCVAVPQSTDYKLSGTVRVEAAGVTLDLLSGCEFFSLPDCSGTNLGSDIEATVLSATAGSWQPVARSGVMPAGAVSAWCSFALHTATGASFTAFLDRLELEIHQIFADGFE